jgi:hypothetical protein
MQMRVLVSSAEASKGWDLRCRVREALIDFLQRQVPDALPRMRAEIERAEKGSRRKRPSPPCARAAGMVARSGVPSVRVAMPLPYPKTPQDRNTRMNMSMITRRSRKVRDRLH